MKKLMTLAAMCVVLMISIHLLHASGPVGIYGMVEKVVFEPSEQAPERIQVWGAFAYADGLGDTGMATSLVRRGYLYFKLPEIIPGPIGQAHVDLIRTEWADLKAVASAGQAIAFGNWDYIGGFGGLDPAATQTLPPYILQRVPRGGELTDMRVRPAAETPAAPAVYQTNAGIVRLSADGNHAYIVKELRAALAAIGGVR
jgi:hypothetical protein